METLTTDLARIPFAPLVVCVDVGSTTSGKFGWWSSAGVGGTTPSGVSVHVARELDAGSAVALGFECPLFVPIAVAESKLTSQRPGEGNRSWSAAAGLGAMGVGVAQVPWIFRDIRSRLSRTHAAYLNWAAFHAAGAGLFVWEAFVSGRDKRGTHIADAEAAVLAFIDALPNPQTANKIAPIPSVICLAGAALLRTGWSNDIGVLGEAVLVIAPAKG